MADKEAVLATYICELLASGNSHDAIVAQLVTDGIEDPISAIHAVYESWTTLASELQLHTEDTMNWHVFMRMNLLQQALTGNFALALKVLDSLAAIQGLSHLTVSAEKPLEITLVPKAETKTEET